jgi:short-subunit dehydrogenase
MLITGASAGIGRALAVEAAQAGAKVILLARSGDKLAELCQEIHQLGGQAAYFTVDLSDRTSLHDGVKRMQQQFPVIDILVNNAGIGWYGLFHDMPVESVQNLLDLNINALTEVTRIVLPAMLAQRQGKIVNISSIIGDLAAQGAVLYAASKTYVNAFSRALMRELRGSGVQVVAAKVGPVETGFFSRMKDAGSLHIPGEAMAVPVERVAKRLVQLCAGQRSGSVYIPAYYALFPLVERWLGWIIDLVGPVLLLVRK